MIDELRETYGVTRLTATLDPANTASLALLRKLGLGLDWTNATEHEVGYALDLPEREK
jgi:RimJ/RimL family protein N-acetyltransferase